MFHYLRQMRPRVLLGWLLLLSAQLSFAAEQPPVRVGIDAEFGLANSTSAQAVELGVRAAVDEINAAGGVLGGRKIEIVTKDHRSIPARGIRNIKEFAAMPEVVAVFGGRFSPVIIEEMPTLRELHMPFLAVWSSADGITRNGMQPNYVFRLSLRDELAIPAMLQAAQRRGVDKIGLLLTNTSWGRSGLAAAQRYVQQAGGPGVVEVAWYNWKDKSLVGKYRELLAAGAQGVLLVANDDEAATLVREVAALPPAQRVPIFSHWGITGGEFVRQAGPALAQVDLSVIQTFSFFEADPAVLQRFMATLARISDIRRIEDIEAPVGVAHAYDMMHILARAIEIAGSTDRAAIRDALEQVGTYHGLVRTYDPPFTPTRHEALTPEQLLMARYREDGVLVPVERGNDGR